MIPLCPITGKLGYPNRGMAREAMKVFAARRTGSHVERSSYKCVHCDRWHLSSQPQAVVNRRTREDKVLRAFAERRYA